MTSQECVIDAVQRAQGVLADYIETNPRDCAKTLERLFVIFTDDELTRAVDTLNLEAVLAVMEESEARQPSSMSLPYNRTSG